MKEKKSHKTATRQIGGPRATKSIPWSFCAHCGLVYLKNEKTKKEMRSACEDNLWREE